MDAKERYLGEDTDALRQRIDRFESLKGARDDRRKARGRLVRLLRSERLLGMDGATGSLVSAMSRAGAFRLGGVIVGTTAFRLYEGELGLRLSFDETAMTNDIDIASFEKLSLALEDTVEPALEEVFNDLSFSPSLPWIRARSGVGDSRERKPSSSFSRPRSTRTRGCSIWPPWASTPSRSTTSTT